MEQRLSLAGAACHIPTGAVHLYLGDVPAECDPARDLPLVVRTPATAVVPAVPLEPPPRVVGMDPSALPPVGKRLRGIDVEKIQRGIVPLVAQPGAAEPARGEFGGTVSHVTSH